MKSIDSANKILVVKDGPYDDGFSSQWFKVKEGKLSPFEFSRRVVRETALANRSDRYRELLYPLNIAAYPQEEVAVTQELYSVRNKIYMVINSPGGTVSLADSDLSIAEGLVPNPKNRHIYVLGEAASAATIPFENFDKRYVLKDSNLMWHRGHDKTPNGLDVILNQELEEMGVDCFTSEMDDIFDEEMDESCSESRSFFEKNANQKSQLKVKTAFDEFEKDIKENEVNFTGNELLEMGIAKAAYAKVAGIQNKLRSDLGLESVASLDLPIFKLARIEEILRKLFTAEINLWRREDNTLIYASSRKFAEAVSSKSLNGLFFSSIKAEAIKLGCVDENGNAKITGRV